MRARAWGWPNTSPIAGEYDARTIASDAGFHLVYGVAAAAAYRALA